MRSSVIKGLEGRLKIRATVDVAADISTVFESFRDLRFAAKYIRDISNLEILDGGPAKMVVGSRWRETRVLLGREASEVMWVTEMSQPTSYSVAAVSHGTEYLSQYIFSILAPDRTRVVVLFTGRPYTLLARVVGVLGIFAARTIRKLTTADLEDLARAVEANAKELAR